MNNRSKTTAIYLFMGLLLITGVNCKQKPDTLLPVTEVHKTRKISKTIKEIAQFANITITDSTEIDDLLQFKEVDEEGKVIDIDQEKAEELFKSLKKLAGMRSLPIVEIKNTEQVVLAVRGKGFSGNIWARLLVNRATGEIHKIKFEHKAESDGYGAAITKNAFSAQFIEVMVDPEVNCYGLLQDGKMIVDGKNNVDGISGATATSRGAVDMLNAGLHRYAFYLQ